MNHAFAAAEPFPHLVLDGFVPADALLAASKSFECPAVWHKYDGPDEKGKKACRKPGRPARDLLDALNSPAAARIAEWVTGIEGLQADPTLHGGGLHVTEPGGWLGCHLDSERHPENGLQRRLNLIVYCTPDWQDDWGGELELWAADLSRPVQRIVPRFGRAVLFECGPRSYHGHARVTGPVARRSLAVYFWSEHRARARFVRTADETWDAHREATRSARSR